MMAAGALAGSAQAAEGAQVGDSHCVQGERPDSRLAAIERSRGGKLPGSLGRAAAESLDQLEKTWSDQGLAAVPDGTEPASVFRPARNPNSELDRG